MHRGNWRENIPGAIAPQHPEFNDCNVGDLMPAFVKEQCWVPNTGTAPLVLPDLPHSWRSTESLSQRPGRQALGWHPRNPVGKGQ